MTKSFCPWQGDWLILMLASKRTQLHSTTQEKQRLHSMAEGLAQASTG
jgi:hypothetical protein